jgi:hypothetical protein
VTITPLDAPPLVRTYRIPADPDSPEPAWRGSLPPLPAGRFEVAVEVGGVPGIGVVRAQATIVALDPDPAADADDPDDLGLSDGKPTDELRPEAS